MCRRTSGDASQLLRLICHSPALREMSVTEQRYQAVHGVMADGRTVGDVASQWDVSRRTLSCRRHGNIDSFV
jgi:hypothetical protein